MFEQFIFAYIGGVVIVVGMEIASMLKARRMNLAATEAGLIARANAKAEASPEPVSYKAETPQAANEQTMDTEIRLAS